MQYIATLRSVFSADNDAQAIIIAEHIREAGEALLDLEDDDSIDVTQVTSNPLELSPEESLVTLYRARNQLIRTRVKWAVLLAQEIDKAAWVLKHRAEGEPEFTPPYPYGAFTELLQAIIQRKENPLEVHE